MTANIIINNSELDHDLWIELGRPHAWYLTNTWESPTKSVRIEVWKDVGYGKNMIIHNNVAVKDYSPILFTQDENWIVVIDEESLHPNFNVYWKWGSFKK